MGPGQSKWQPIYFGMFSVTVVANVIATLVFDMCAECTSLREEVLAGGHEGAVNGTVIVSAMEAFRIMIILPADYLTQKFVEPLRERQRQEGREEGRKEGRAELRSEMLEWLRRRDEAQSQGLEFTEPMPGSELNGGGER